MYKAAIEHARNAIANATLHTDPFDHIYVENVFPEDFYATLQVNLPDTQFYDRLADTPRVSPNYNRERYFISSTLSSLNKLPGAQRDFWLEFLRAMYVQSFAHSVLTKFGPTIQTCFAKEAGHEGMDLNLQWNALLIRDLAQYSLPPHTDSPGKLVATLFYLPGLFGAPELGTTLYTPRDPEFECSGIGRHYKFEQFHQGHTMAYQPNTLFAFAKTSQSFHRVEPVPPQVARDVLLFDIRRDEGEVA